MPTPDIEIYLQETPANAVMEWLAGRFPDHPAAMRPAGKKQWRTVLRHGAASIPVLVIEDAAPGFTSVWLNSPHTPWNDDQACARDAHAHFGREVRATAGSWQEGEDPDAWWCISAAGEKLIHWPG